jgi:hypothetical protein
VRIAPGAVVPYPRIDMLSDRSQPTGTVLVVALVGAAAALSPILWSDSMWSWSEPDVIDFLILAWQFLPFAVLIFTREHFGTLAFVVAVALVVVATVAADLVVEHDTGSTAAVALLWVPVWLTMLIGIALLIMRAARGQRTGPGRV